MTFLVLIPTFDSERFILQTLKSIENIEYDNFRVYISDNHSSDSTINIIQDFIKKTRIKDRITLYRHNKNIGRINNWNHCLEQVKEGQYNYFKFLAAGDTLESNSLKEYVEMFRKDEQIGIITSNHAVTENGAKKIIKHFNKTQIIDPENALLLSLKKANYFGAFSFIAYNSRYLENIIFDERLDFVADWRLNIDLLLKYRCKIGYINKPLSIMNMDFRKKTKDTKGDNEPRNQIAYMINLLYRELKNENNMNKLFLLTYRIRSIIIYG